MSITIFANFALQISCRGHFKVKKIKKSEIRLELDQDIMFAFLHQAVPIGDTRKKTVLQQWEFIKLSKKQTFVIVVESVRTPEVIKNKNLETVSRSRYHFQFLEIQTETKLARILSIRSVARRRKKSQITIQGVATAPEKRYVFLEDDFSSPSELPGREGVIRKSETPILWAKSSFCVISSCSGPLSMKKIHFLRKTSFFYNPFTTRYCSGQYSDFHDKMHHCGRDFYRTLKISFTCSYQGAGLCP